MSVKAINDTRGPHGFVPSALVFGNYPPVRGYSEPPNRHPSLEDRAAVANTARKSFEKYVAEDRVQRALAHRPPAATNVTLEPGQEVLTWRERVVAGRIGEWTGPHIVDRIDHSRKLVYVRLMPADNITAFNIAQVKLYVRPDHAADRVMTVLFNRLRHFSNPPRDVLHTTVLQPRDPRCHTPEMRAAKKAEIDGLLSRGTFQIVCPEDIPPGANVLPGRFVLAIKSDRGGPTKWKARFVVGGHRDKFKKLMVHTSQALQTGSVRLILALAAVLSFDVWTADVKQDYLQTDSNLLRDVFIRTDAEEFSLAPDEALKLIRPLHGLAESGDLWHMTLDRHHTQDLRMHSLPSDSALYYLLSSSGLEGISGTYADDILCAGTPCFRTTNARSDMGPDSTPPCHFTGFLLDRDSDGSLRIDQSEYLARIPMLPTDGDYTAFSSIRMRLAWMGHSRPDCLYEISQFAQITRANFECQRASIVKRVNRLTEYARKNPLSLRFPKLRMDSLRILGVSDASFATNDDTTSHLGFIILLGDATDRVAPLVFRTYKARRVTRSVFGAELICFADLFDCAYTLTCEFRRLLPSVHVPLMLYTDNKSLFDVVSKGSRTAERRLMLDIAVERNAFHDREISDIGFLRSRHNIADGLTKPMQQAALRTVLTTSHWRPEAEQ